MSNKYEAIKKAVFYAQQDPAPLAALIAGTVTDVATTVKVAGDTEITIPAGDTAATADYTATVFSQFGDVMQGESVTWSVTSATGVSISSGTVSVAKTASAGTITVTATDGTVSGSIEVTLAEAAGE